VVHCFSPRLLENQSVCPSGGLPEPTVPPQLTGSFTGYQPNTPGFGAANGDKNKSEHLT
jgi:hypothetical protein